MCVMFQNCCSEITNVEKPCYVHPTKQYQIMIWQSYCNITVVHSVRIGGLCYENVNIILVTVSPCLTVQLHVLTVISLFL